MFYDVILHFKGQEGIHMHVKADTPTGAVLHVLAQDWTIAERKDFLGCWVDVI